VRNVGHNRSSTIVAETATFRRPQTIGNGLVTPVRRKSVSSLTIILIIIAVAAVAVAIFMYIQWDRTKRLRGKFGPEYDRVVHDHENARKAEDELLSRQKRIEKLHIRDLNQPEIERFSESWRTVQTQFVDAPREAVAQADRLIRDVMSTRGYPMTDFEQRAADISVDHPRVVEHYRVAHDIAERDAAGKADTEDLRQAMMHYRALFEELLSAPRERQTQEVRK
jgi:hypothetical protein